MEDQNNLDQPDSRKIKIRRVIKERQKSGPDGRFLFEDEKKTKPLMERDPDFFLTMLTYPKGEGLDTWIADAGKDEFEVPALIAEAAIKTGYFEQSPETITKLKNTVKEQTDANS